MLNHLLCVIHVEIKVSQSSLLQLFWESTAWIVAEVRSCFWDGPESIKFERYQLRGENWKHRMNYLHAFGRHSYPTLKQSIALILPLMCKKTKISKVANVDEEPKQRDRDTDNMFQSASTCRTWSILARLKTRSHFNNYSRSGLLK